MDSVINPEQPLALERLLGAVPMRNHSVRWETRDEGRVVVYVKIRPRWYMRPPLSWLLRFSPERGVALDKLGCEVWNACDGQRSTERIIESFADRHHLTFHEARLSVMEFLRRLTRRGLIVMVGMSPEEAVS